MRKVLVVDDEPSILRTTSALLATSGFDVATCDQPQRILSTIEEERPDIVLHDVRMPGLDIDDMVLAIRERWRDLPIVLFTAGMDGDEIARRVRANGILEKPFRPSELLDTIAKACPAAA